ncbi:hypothetical protein TNCV_2453671 [Trichonephila clavipes]|nr:hypothetical protein TNCV_2453671 [Trichonephila clavipes]
MTPKLIPNTPPNHTTPYEFLKTMLCEKVLPVSWCRSELLEIGYYKDSSEPGTLYPVFHCLQAIGVCDASGVKSKLNGGWIGDLLCFLMKAGSALVPMMAMCWSEGGQGNACNQTI